MKKDQNLKCKQKLWESFNAFAMGDIENSKEGKVRTTNEWRQKKVIEQCEEG